ncbi:uncharacterized protein LOC124134494 [Haliotis rufescens]|uniref:uncharacterized protein LOC124134494 n=1 Tax=Haliotis rufescens TaxID=6454 RepID=UPI00201E7903|nr:uncharacterized protein LOC124134494 [Haliotis rufescens]
MYSTYLSIAATCLIWAAVESHVGPGIAAPGTHDHTIPYTIVNGACHVGSSQHAVGDVFTHPDSGECIKYRCEAGKVVVDVAQSGCQDESHCRPAGQFTSVCNNKFSCELADVSVVGSNEVKVEEKITVLEEKGCQVLGKCRQPMEKVHMGIMKCHCRGAGHTEECTF